MREAVIVSTARSPIGRAYRGAFNDTSGLISAAIASNMLSLVRVLTPLKSTMS